MSTTEKTDAGTAGHKRKGGPGQALKRYGPFVLVAVVVVGAIAIFGSGGDEGDDDTAGPATVTDRDELTESGPMTPAKAKMLGQTVDFGPNCDTATERVKIPSLYAPPCVEPFTGDNGGATSPGVTADEILIIRYAADPKLDPVTTALLNSGGADTDPAVIKESIDDYAALYSSILETYGRKLRIEDFTATATGADPEGQKADAIAIADKKPFAVLAGSVSESFATELATREIICAPGCLNAPRESLTKEYEPYIWSTTPSANQLVALAGEMIAKLAGPGKAELAGDEAMRSQSRVYGLLHYNTPDRAHDEAYERFRDVLSDSGIELATDIEFMIDPSTAQENARTNILKLKQKGVTTVLYYGDPYNPGYLTKAATEQGYFPEWILGPSVLADATFFGRTYDQQQWGNGFGMSLSPARGDFENYDPVRIYEWAYGKPPPANTVLVNEPPLRMLLTGIHLAGPNLTPDTFRDGLYRYPPSGGVATLPLLSWGENEVWPDVDPGGVDDIALVWWDPAATGEDELGNDGSGMYRYAKAGARYTVGKLPATAADAGLFDDASSILMFDDLPATDEAPTYPPPDIED
jgi:hypothetical protein